MAENSPELMLLDVIDRVELDGSALGVWDNACAQAVRSVPPYARRVTAEKAYIRTDGFLVIRAALGKRLIEMLVRPDGWRWSPEGDMD